MPTLSFKGKTVVETYHHTVAHHVLEFDEKLSVLPKGQTASLDGNLIIEGDNLLALKALLPTHAGKVKCIYIDPPYNTGEENWVYNDNLTHPLFKEWIHREVGKEGEDASRHDKWCCMMYPRLRLLQELLSDKGVILVSIDENEVGSLRLLMDEVFRVEKPLATLVWKRRSPTGMRGDPVSVDHEYVLVYAKNPTKVELTGLLMTADDYTLQDHIGRFASTDLTIGMTKEERPNQFYPIANPRTGAEYAANPDRVWRFEPAEMKRVIEDKNNLIIWPDEQSEQKMTRPRFKTRFDPMNPKLKPISSWIESSSRKPDDDDEEGDDVRAISSGLNAEGGRVLSRIFGEKVFNYPKPPSLIQALVQIAAGEDETVLDSFAGSGTTGQAVLEANMADGKSRKFILVQMRCDTLEQEHDRKNICENVTAARVRSVISGYFYQPNGKKQNVPGLGGSFTYARLGEPLFSEYKSFGKKAPTFAQLARYVFYTHTSQQIDQKKIKEETGFIGSTEMRGGTSFYLFYTPDQASSREVSTKTLEALLKKDKNPNWMLYCEKVWLHPEQVREFEREHNKRITLMLVPFDLK